MAPSTTSEDDSSTHQNGHIVETTKRAKSRSRKQAEHARDVPNSHTNGSVVLKAPKPSIAIDGWEKGKDPKVDYSGHFEFGGAWGVSAMMVGFPLLMYYMWIGATYYNGKFPRPAPGESFSAFLGHMRHLAATGAYPSLKAWTMYWTFLIFEAACYVLMPGIWNKGKPLPHEDGKRLDYYCSGMWSWWTTIILALTLHFTGIFKLYTIIDEFGPLMSVAIISGYLVAAACYVSAVYRGKQHRMSGSLPYDFFMGAELNPRLFGILDFKMFLEVRLPWFILFLITLGTAARQYEQFDFVSPQVCFLLMAHFLYTNACAKGEECITTTWDMYYEKLGFMLIFWNMAGVPLTYCHCTIYLANHAPSVYAWNKYAMALWFVIYLFVYWIWDTANSQKNRYRQQEMGSDLSRKAFPQLPWQTVENPRIFNTEDGHTVLADGWCAYPTLSLETREAHYHRWLSSKDSLHLRFILCIVMGSGDWI